MPRDGLRWFKFKNMSNCQKDVKWFPCSHEQWDSNMLKCQMMKSCQKMSNVKHMDYGGSSKKII